MATLRPLLRGQPGSAKAGSPPRIAHLRKRPVKYSIGNAGCYRAAALGARGRPGDAPRRAFRRDQASDRIGDGVASWPRIFCAAVAVDCHRSSASSAVQRARRLRLPHRRPTSRRAANVENKKLPGDLRRKSHRRFLSACFASAQRRRARRILAQGAPPQTQRSASASRFCRSLAAPLQRRKRRLLCNCGTGLIT